MKNGCEEQDKSHKFLCVCKHELQSSKQLQISGVHRREKRFRNHMAKNFPSTPWLLIEKKFCKKSCITNNA